jgi:phospholipid/cholesterol/gamma-HCH transport system substrate-binding protein
MKQTANLETKIGIFLLLGIGLLCTLIVLFGEMPDLFKPSYTLTVRFPNASGLLKGSDVYLSGALIGKVTTNPQPIPDTQKVEVKLKIDKNVGIRQDATYVIGSAGLLGDKYVEVRPVVYPEQTPDEKKAPAVYDGELIEGEIPTDVNTLMTSAQPLIEKANDIAARLDNVMKKLDDQVLSGTSTDDLKETIAKLRHMVDNGDSMISNANDLLSEAKTGKGVVGRLLNDKQLGDNVAAFIANLKAHGPIFYKDDTGVTDKDNNSDRDNGRRKKNK